MIPRLCVAANSGARIGLSESVKKSFKVAFKDPFKSENGFDFLYITKEDYENFDVANKSIMTEPVTTERKFTRSLISLEQNKTSV